MSTSASSPSTISPSASPIPHIHLLCMDSTFSKAFTAALKTHKFTLSHTIHNCALSWVPSTAQFTCIVSPANSYGRLDGGFDDAISRSFSPRGNYLAMTRVAQEKLYEEWKGFAPPGTCTLARIPDEFGEGEMKSKNIWGTKYLALCPTMRVPGSAKWDREVAYECVWSLLCGVERHNRLVREKKEKGECDVGVKEEEMEDQEEKKEDPEEEITSLLMTPLGTGIGRVSAEKWANQAVLAIKHFVEACEKPEKWGAMEPGEIYDHVNEVIETWDL